MPHWGQRRRDLAVSACQKSRQALRVGSRSEQSVASSRRESSSLQARDGSWPEDRSSGCVGQVEKLHRGNILVDSFRRELALVEQIELILADGFEVQHLGALAEIAGEAGYVVDVVFLRFRGQVAQLHVFQHALP